MPHKISGRFRKLDVAGRRDLLAELGYHMPETLGVETADRMIENVTGVFGLPQALVPNFPVNGRYYNLPLVEEEPSVVAALTYAGLTADRAGGFKASLIDETSLLVGQIHIADCTDQEKAINTLKTQRKELVERANGFVPNMVGRGGGVKSIEIRILSDRFMVVELAVDTRDAMGANAVNTLCEAMAPYIQDITGGEVVMKILSNLVDHSLVEATVSIPCSILGTEGVDGETVRDRIIMAHEIAMLDPYRAATHNKGIMNGIDSVAVATGNDWRAIEAAAHAYAGIAEGYKPLTHWSCGQEGELVGRIELPLKPGTVGGSLLANPAVKANLDLLGVKNAHELAEIMAAVGLAQNFSALRALVTAGIQKGHMKLHARSAEGGE